MFNSVYDKDLTKICQSPTINLARYCQEYQNTNNFSLYSLSNLVWEIKQPCINYLLLCNKLLQTRQLKTACIYYLSVSVGQESSYSLTGYSAKGHPTVIEVWVRLPSHLEAQMGKNLFPDSLRLLAELISLWISKEG